MQFRNAVLTPKGIELLGAANINKPVVFTRFLFTDSTEPLFGSETDLPPNTWGNGSVDAVVNQGELGQFVIYASASNAVDYGYARGYGIYAKLRDEDTDHLVCVANALGNAVEVTESSGGYSRFHVALTIKYAVADNVVVVEPNLAGLISRGEFEDWVKRVVTTTSASGAPYGDDQMIYGKKTFATNMEIGYINMVGLARRLMRRQLTLYGNMRITDDIIPYYYAQDPSQSHDLGAEDARWERLYVNGIYTNWIKKPMATMRLDLSKLSDTEEFVHYAQDTLSGGIICKNFADFNMGDSARDYTCRLGYKYVMSGLTKVIRNVIPRIDVAIPHSLGLGTDVKWSVKIYGESMINHSGRPLRMCWDFAVLQPDMSVGSDHTRFSLALMTAPSYSENGYMLLDGAYMIITAERNDITFSD